MSRFCPRPYWGDMVSLNGLRGVVDREWSQYDPEKKRAGWHLVLFEDGSKRWGHPGKLTRLHEEFLGMPNEHHFPNPSDPILSWQEIPHGYDEYLTWDLDAGCLYCGLSEGNPIHVEK